MILALDFDGVVWDSVGECYQMARRTYRALHGVEAAECEKAFRSGRWLVRCGGDFLFVLEMVQADPSQDLTDFSKEEFARQLSSRGADAKRFETEFYRQRQVCRQEDPAGWLAMQQPYPQFLAALPQLQQRFDELVVCTTKDEASTRQLLQTVHLDLSIWGRDHGVDKGAQIRDLCQQRGVQAKDVCFVDDLLDNLEQVRPTGARLFLADWGYNTPAEQAQARGVGVRVVSATGLAEQLCDA